MEINGKKLCTYCFEERPDNQGSCSLCGYEEVRRPLDAVLAPGTLLMGKYTVGKVLGKGGFGVTYLAYDLKRECRVAIKEYMPDTLAYRTPGNTLISTYEGDKEESFRLGAEKFYEEARTVSRFNGHPNIINVQEFFYENNTAYFVMEYIEGVDLKTYVAQKGGTLPEDECLQLLMPILDALIVVHSVGVLHRDISPDNIYVTKDGGMKLLDFGAARQVLGEKSKSLSVVLKPGFAPIEQYQTRGKQGQWTDVYALAATMYYCLTGQVPEAAMDRVEAEMENREADGVYLSLKNNSAVSPRMAGVLHMALALRAANRYQNMMEFKQALLTAQGQTVPAPEIQKSAEKKIEIEIHKKRELSGKKRNTVIIAACLVVLCAVTITAFKLGSSSKDGVDMPVGAGYQTVVEENTEPETQNNNDAVSAADTSGESGNSVQPAEEAPEFEEATLAHVSGNVALQGEWIYYTNISDGRSIYKVKTDGSGKMKLNQNVSYHLFVQDDWVYYRNSSDLYGGENTNILYRMKTDGSGKEQLSEDTMYEITYIDNWIYYANGSDGEKLYRINNDGSQRTKLNEDKSSEINAAGDWLYYQNQSDNSTFYRVRNDGTGRQKLTVDGVNNLTVSVNRIYYLKNGDLFGMKTDGSGETVISEDAARYIEVTEEWVYYSNIDDGDKLYRIRADGTGRQKLNEDSSIGVSVVGEWIYYNNYSDGERLYRIRFDGSERSLFE